MVQNVEVFDNDPGVTLSMRIEHENVEDTAFVLLGTLGPMALGIIVNGATPSDSVYANVLPPNWRPY